MRGCLRAQAPHRPLCRAAATISGVHRDPWHLSVQKHTPELRQWQARLHQLDDAAKPSGEPGGSASGYLLWLIGWTFFARGRVMEGFKGRVATYIERIQFRREAPWTRS